MRLMESLLTSYLNELHVKIFSISVHLVMGPDSAKSPAVRDYCE
jgi:hypothetical protein